MQLTVESDDPPILIVLFEGEILQEDFATEPDPLAKHLGPSGYARHIILDMSGVSFFSSIGVGWLLNCFSKAKALKGRLAVHGFSDYIMRMLMSESMSVMTYMVVVGDREEARERIEDDAFWENRYKPAP